MHIANMITSIRIFLAPIFITCFLYDNVYAKLISLIIVIACEITDMLDGYVARKYGTVTNLGKLLDPLADSLFRFSVFLSFFALGYAQIWMVAIIFYRDTIVSWIRIIAASENFIVSARTSGKIKAWVQGLSIFTIVSLITASYWQPIPHIKTIGFALMTFTTIVTAYSAVDYFWGNLDLLRSASKANANNG